jgi:hypothetical protein
MANPELQSSWGDAVRGVGVEFREFFSQNADAYTPSWEPVVKTMTDNAAQATFSGKTGVGVLPMFAEGSAVPKANRFKLYDTAFVHKQYGKQLEVTRLQLINRDWNSQFDEFKDLVVSGKVTLSKAAAQIFNNAFSNSGVATKNGIQVTTYNDGKNLASTVHPRVDGGTAQSNASSTGIPLTESNFETGRVALLEQLQDDGTPITVTGAVWCVVPTALEKTAKIITMSDKRSDTGDNDVNIYNGGGYPVMSSIWLGAAASGSDTQWQLVAPSIAKLVLIIRTSMDMDQSVDKNTKSTLFDVIADWSVGSKDWHGTYFSKGDSAAYSS